MAPSIPFWKVQSIGNDFPLIHIEDVQSAADARLSSIDFDLAKLAVQISHRRFGVGGDGLLAIAMEEGDLRLRMFNPDGTEDFCGNGIRCAVDHAVRHLGMPSSFKVRHLEKIIPVRVQDDKILTTLDAADYTPSKVPHNEMSEIFSGNVWSGMDSGMPLSLFGSALTTGSTHVVIPTSALPDDDSFRSVSAKIEIDARYPQRTSVIWRQEIEPMRLKIRIWERGVGETLGCGTGSSAAAADYLRQKGRGGTVEVLNPGGSLSISMDSWNSSISVEGTAAEIYSGTFLTQ